MDQFEYDNLIAGQTDLSVLVIHIHILLAPFYQEKWS